MRPAMPTLSWAASTSSIGAVTYRHESSIRSTAGSVGMPGGEGVRYSPTSPFTSATMPGNGARTTVREVSAREALMRASASATWARADSQPATRAFASLSARSTRSSETKPLSRSCRVRAASRIALSASRQASRSFERAEPSCSRETLSRATRSSFQSSSSSCPSVTRSPSRTASFSIRPPSGGASFARRQAETEPARVLATVVSTRPVSAAAASTATGFARVANHRAAAAAATRAAASKARRRARERVVEFIAGEV